VIRAHRLLAAHEAGEASLTTRLGYDERHRRRLTVASTRGERVLLDLPEATRLRHGDRIAMDDGRILAVEAEDEPVAEIFADGPHALARLAWHLGNRHTPTAILPDRLRIRRDHVLEAMVARLGARVVRTEAPFDPEVGAYHDGGGHGHHHHDDEADGGHAHAH
jgi:urease accessory protein